MQCVRDPLSSLPMQCIRDLLPSLPMKCVLNPLSSLPMQCVQDLLSRLSSHPIQCARDLPSNLHIQWLRDLPSSQLPSPPGNWYLRVVNQTLSLCHQVLITTKLRCWPEQKNVLSSALQGTMNLQLETFLPLRLVVSKAGWQEEQCSPFPLGSEIQVLTFAYYSIPIWNYSLDTRYTRTYWLLIS